MRHYQDIDIRRWPRCRSARKKDLPFAVRFAVQAGVMATLEGDVPYARGDALAWGPRNERWPIAAAYFAENYLPAPGTKAGRDGQYCKKPVIVAAAPMTEDFSVAATGGALLRGEAGDWLVQYEQGHYGIVRHDIFSETYELLDEEDE